MSTKKIVAPSIATKRGRMNKQDICADSEDDITPGAGSSPADADVQQGVARHAQVGIQPARHDERSDVVDVAEDGSAEAEPTGRDRPENDDVGRLPAVGQ